jgi:hypothetical protein
LRALLVALGYGRLNVETVVRHVDAHGDAETCLAVRQCHRALVEMEVARQNLLFAPAEAWGPETDEYRWEPGLDEEDRQWAAETSPFRDECYTLVEPLR